MASRVAEVLYRLRDAFSDPARRILDRYGDIQGASRRTARQVESDTGVMARGFGRARSAVAGFVSAFTLAASLRGINRAADDLDRLGKTAERLDLDPQTLAGFEFALERSGVAASKAARAIETLQKRTGEALQGTGQAARAFERLGIEVERFAELGADAQLVLLAEALRGVASEEERAALAAQLFARANTDVLNLLNQGGAAVRDYLAEFARYNTVTRESVQAAAEYNDALENLSTRLSGLRNQVVPPVLNGINRALALFDDEPLAQLERRLEVLRTRQDNGGFLNSLFYDDGELAGEIANVEAQIARLVDARADEAAAAQRATAGLQAEVAARQQQAQAVAEYRESVAGLSGLYGENIRALQNALAAETRELEKARRDQAAIEREFGQARADLVAPDDEDLGLGDIYAQIREAQAAAAEGNNQAAIDAARGGIDLLARLKEQGEDIPAP